jgi:hypothetical protein
MPSRVLVGEAIWGSDKIAKCTTRIPATVGVYYAWFYMLADANGSFEVTNPRAVHSKIAQNLPFLTCQHVVTILSEFEREGLLFVWEHDGKRYGHWTGSQVPGRLPAGSHRERYAILAPLAPKEELDRYRSTYSKGVRMQPGFGSKPVSGQSPLPVSVSVSVPVPATVTVEDKDRANPARDTSHPFDQEKNRKSEAKTDRLQGEAEVRTEANVGSGPELPPRPQAESERIRHHREIGEEWERKRASGEIPRTLGKSEYRQQVLKQESEGKSKSAVG